MSTVEKRPSRNVIDLKTGEVVDLVSAPTERVAELATNMADVRARIGEVEQAISMELVTRLDRSATWTLRVGDPTRAQWEITAPSPAAGTEAYPPDALVGALDDLLAGGVITLQAASKACKRQLVITLDVPWGNDPAELADMLRSAANVEIAGVRVDVVKADPSTRPVAAGIAALRKIPGTTALLDEAKVTQPPPARRAKVVRK
jgi:hypothetical protein